LRLGLAVYSPFGLSTEWNSGWVGRYQGITSRLTSVNITPAAAWQVTPWLSLGAGFQAMYADAKLSNALDTGAQVGASTFFDSTATFRGNDWAFGWSIGATVVPTRGVILGVSWRSPLTLNLSGDAEFSVNPAWRRPRSPPRLSTARRRRAWRSPARSASARPGKSIRR